jgi:hypothetical protein
VHTDRELGASACLPGRLSKAARAYDVEPTALAVVSERSLIGTFYAGFRWRSYLGCCSTRCGKPMLLGVTLADGVAQFLEEKLLAISF